jgi:branched-chain amino acid transport system ATP-binding protein
LQDIGLAERADELAQNLSHGEQRVLEVGLAMATAPKLLLLDEPMAGTGPEESQRIVDLIAGLKSRVAILLVEQRVAEALSSCDHGYVLQTGRIALEGVPSVLMEDPHVKEIYLGM